MHCSSSDALSPMKGVKIILSGVLCPVVSIQEQRFMDLQTSMQADAMHHDVWYGSQQ